MRTSWYNWFITGFHQAEGRWGDGGRGKTALEPNTVAMGGQHIQEIRKKKQTAAAGQNGAQDKKKKKQEKKKKMVTKKIKTKT